jgi:hypothetical protein
MTLSGWIFMIVSLSAAATLMVSCYYKILTAPPKPPNDPSEE